MIDTQVAELTIKALLAGLHAKLTDAALIAKAARACADAGSISECIRVSMDLDQLVYDASRLHDAITAIESLM
ncbi:MULTISPECIES: hypothetical protein [unclassified Bradyrhizobium]|uniref:hypothetical protein n=1 Tax=unclassified Bradyrhizobium TaxID=2631580 RepID=UPI00247A710B|nr:MULTISPECIES: hypothetical protein [unclassified Bradyrhizobium]WGR73892.1 hypothetical protein MTX24_14215 [Bradyrhizobium sp. ISRA426]WGR78729.1 hypothetical protein MTX21_39185 [Bradyrhizobium sp. ISRA430]WGR89131.1 hypothetical protein MTX25_14230 [Bradyrhizobium sp. ISRA432]